MNQKGKRIVIIALALLLLIYGVPPASGEFCQADLLKRCRSGTCKHCLYFDGVVKNAARKSAFYLMIKSQQAVSSRFFILKN